jgi:hypothetical protein
VILAASTLVAGCHREEARRERATATASAQPTTTGRSAASGSLTFRAPGAEPLAPPPLARPPAAPALPALPPLTGHPKPAAPPPRGDDVHGCGQVWSGTEWVSVACIDPANHPSRARIAQPVVPFSLLRAPIEHLPAVVDHRADGTEGPVRKQRGPECTAFAFTAAADHALARWTGTAGNLSVMQVWARYVRFNEKGAADENAGQLLADESAWPYDPTEANGWIRCPANADPKKVCGKPVDQAKLAALERRAVAEVTQIEVLSTADLDVLRAKLAAGQDATVAVRLPSFATAGDPGAKYVIGVRPDKPPTAPKMGHEVLLSGYAMLPQGTYYLVHNSFGPSWGDGGFAWIHEETLKTHWNDSRIYVVDAQPLQIARRKRRAQGGLTAPCPAGELPDSISGLCARRCPDRSPRHNDVCAVAGQCRAGQVNLTGECLMAAPSAASGTDPGTRVRWSCGPGGCAYWLPQGQAGCTRAECSVSCPAPDFRLATGPKGIVCVE